MDRVSGPDAERTLGAAIAEHREALAGVGSLAEPLAAAADAIATSLAAGGCVLACGNGGSASDAQHLVAELVGRYLKERAPYSAIALTANTSALTAIANDYGFDEVFARQVRAHGRAGDVLVAISTSGDSPNVLRAVEAARECGMTSIGLAGAAGGALAPLCDISLVVPAASTPRVQEMHALLAHVLCGLVEDALS